ncbi:sulfotransferase [Roseateles sp. DAIF2]|uniref:hypothetical protein n=1 Tax=Roseateles sp. DAIF2 TaxID=2714952 RepID=UPI0018A2A7D2|nr:hypothetical protein [Roseateles sp. DAIF2]QPF73247.1 sulfotransferase [Roseateles sp. DAIF2]
MDGCQALAAIRARRAVPGSALHLQVRRVLVILSASRGGSSLFKETLARHPGIAALDGELDPLLTLSGNGFQLNADSDAIDVPANAEALSSGILDEISFPASDLLGTERLRRKWRNRLLLQYPLHFLAPGADERLQRRLDAALGRIDHGDRRSETELQTRLLEAVYEDEPWRIGFYDGRSAAAGAGRCFDEALKIEEPPFVVPALRRRPLGPDDAREALLLFKSPSDAYRIGLYERLFPHAEVSYLHLTRGFAPSVNGLMDGWLYPLGFFSHRLDCELAIRGYSDVVPFGRRWWKFDLPPNWRRFTAAPLEEVCLNQWRSAHAAILDSGVPTLRLAFEDFIADPAAVLARVTAHLGLPAMTLPEALPVRMATAPPAPRRWHQRAPLLLALGRRPEVGEMMARLGYSMEPATWL